MDSQRPARAARKGAQAAVDHWTDHAPIVLPTEERVAAMLAGTSRKPDEVVGQMRPTNYREFWQYTVEKAAVNAVMAGARPEYLPVILAMAASGMTARQSSTTSWAAPAIVNGPVRQQIGMHCGIGALGPYSHANVAIGRALALLSQNLQGGWYTISGYGPRDTWEQRFRHTLAACEPYSPPILLLDPSAAHGFVERGYAKKQQLIDWLAANAVVTAREYWDDPWVQTLIKPHAVAGVEPWASMWAAPPEQPVRKYRAQDISVVVLGGETQAAWKMVGGNFARAKTVKVDDWR